jgi:hypothetical protein
MEPRTLSKMLRAASALLIASGSVVAARAERLDTAPPAGGNSSAPFVDVPGFGRIQIPPGMQLINPGDAGRSDDDEDGQDLKPKSPLGRLPKSSAPVSPKPVPRKTPQQARAEALNALLGRLKEAADEAEAQAIAVRLSSLFSATPSDTIALLSSRAAAAEIANAQPVAEALFDDIVLLDPSWPEGFVRRARSRAARGDAQGAIEDLQTAIRLEPRRFDALAALGALKEEAGDKKAALDAYRRALALDPKQESWRKSEERLRFEVEGRDI